MVDRFDTKYPTPAHAAAAERRERGRVQDELRHGPRTVLRDRAAKVTIAAALIGAAIGALMLGGSLGQRAAGPQVPAAVTEQAVPAVPSTPPTPAALQIAQVARPGRRGDPPATRRFLPSATMRGHGGRPEGQVKRPPRRQAGSPWIAEPLQGDALRLALIEDRRRTIELNDAELNRLGTAPTAR
jgi:hypothetical protein